MTDTFQKDNTQILLFVRNFIEKHFEFKNKENKQEVIDGVIEYTQILLNRAEQNNRQSANEVKEEAIEKIRNELATKDFVRAELAETKQELKQELAETKQELRQEMAELKVGIIKWFIGVSVSAVVLAVGANFALIGFLVNTLKG